MAHINITYDDIKRIWGQSFPGRPITKVREHPFLARTLMVEFPEWDPDEEPILLTDEVQAVDENAWPLLATVIEATEQRR